MKCVRPQVSTHGDSNQAPWILLSSGNGSRNLGDEAMWEASAEALRSIAGPVRILTDSLPGFRTDLSDVGLLPFMHLDLRRGRQIRRGVLNAIVSKPRNSVYARRRAERVATGHDAVDGSLLQWKNAITKAPGVIFSGAGAINDDFAPHGIAAWWLASTWARAAGVPTYFIGQGIGPLHDRENRRLAANMLTGAALVNVREQDSAITAKELAPSSNPIVSADWASRPIIGESARSQADEYMREYGIKNGFIAISAHRRHSTSSSDLRSLSKDLLNIVGHVSERGQQVVFVPNMLGQGYSDDPATFHLLSKQWPSSIKRAVHVIDTYLGAAMTQAVLAKSALLVTTRYHPMVFAMSCGRPVIGLSYDAYYDQKLEGASQSFQCRDNVFRIGRASSNQLIDACYNAPLPKRIDAEINQRILGSAIKGSSGDEYV